MKLNVLCTKMLSFRAKKEDKTVGFSNDKGRNIIPCAGYYLNIR